MNVTSQPRVGELQRTLGASAQIGKTQTALTKAAAALSSGRAVTKASDAPGDAAASMQIRRNLEIDAGYGRNLAHANRMLSRTDASLGELTELLREARQIGLANTGDQATSAEREGAAEVLRTLERQMLAIANTGEGGIALFGGGNGVAQPFTGVGNGVRFDGGDGTLAGRTDASNGIDFLVRPGDVFGGNSPRVGTKDLDPPLTAATRLSELGGARGQGVERGSIRITSGGVSEIVDLSQADTVGDVVSLINASGVGVTATLTASGIDVSGAGVTIGEVGQATASDLGLLSGVPSGTIVGGDLGRCVTVHTPLADVGVGGGTFKITNGEQVSSIDTSGLATIGELVNAVNAGGLGVTAAISDDGSRVVLRNGVQGASMRVSDTAGTAAQDLGWLTFTADSPLDEFNGGVGVRLDPAGPDLRLTDAGGVAFEVNLDGATTAQDAVDAINAASTAAGASVVASFNPLTPGLELASVSAVANLGTSKAAGDLGLGAPVAGTVVGGDVNGVEVDGPFAHLRSLIRALEGDDLGGAEAALGRLEEAEARVVSVRGEVGGRVREVQQRIERLADGDVVRRELLSRLEDVDYAAAVLEYQTLQTSLQAQLQTTSTLLGRTLFDYLR